MSTTPWDLLSDRASRRLSNGMESAFPGKAPEARWTTPNEATGINDTVTLRSFGAPESPLPVLVVTPQVNHSCIADFAPDQSLVATLLSAGVGRVGVTDWLPPPRDRAYHIADSLNDIRRCIDHLGGRAHLVGLCQGGWQVAMLAALDPERCASLVVAAAPIDAHAGSTLLHAFTLGLPYAFFEGLVTMGGGNVPGHLLSQGFNGLKPFERHVYNPSMAFLAGDDEVFVSRSRALRDWYRMDKDVAGALYLEAVRGIFMENRLARGTFEVEGRRVDLSAIRGPMHLVAGSRDHITPSEQVFALRGLAPHAECHEYRVDAGHIGSFMGRTALAGAWREIGRML